MFWFSLQLLSESFFFVRKIERDRSRMYNRLHVKYPLYLSQLSETWIFSTNFRKNSQMSFLMKIRPLGAELFHAGGLSDMTTLMFALRSFANARKRNTNAHWNKVFLFEVKHV